MRIFASRLTKPLLPAAAPKAETTRHLTTAYRCLTTTAMSEQKITEWVRIDSKTGEFNRAPSSFRDAVSRAAGARFPPEAGRYRLYVSYACPWAHRTLIVRALKGLEDVIPVSVVHWHMQSDGWRFGRDGDGSEIAPAPEQETGAQFIKDIYFKASPGYTGRYTVPALWDRKQKTICSNESSEIIRFLYTEFDDFAPADKKGVNYYPDKLAKQIDELNVWVYVSFTAPARVTDGLTVRHRITSTMACTGLGSPSNRRRMRRLYTRCSSRWTASRTYWPSRRARTCWATS